MVLEVLEVELEDITWLLLDLLHGLEVDRPGEVVDLLDGLANLGEGQLGCSHRNETCMKEVIYSCPVKLENILNC